MTDLERGWPTGLRASNWVRVLPRYSRRVKPLLRGGARTDAVTSQSEYSTVLFRTRADLEELMPRLLQYNTLYFEARGDVMSFLGPEAIRTRDMSLPTARRLRLDRQDPILPALERLGVRPSHHGRCRQATQIAYPSLYADAA